MGSASLGGVRKHRHLGLMSGQHLKALRGRNRDGCQLLGVGVLIQSAVRKHKGSVVAQLTVRNFHQEEGGNQLGARFRLNHLEAGAQGICRGVAGAGNHAVRVSHLNHQTAVVCVIA